MNKSELIDAVSKLTGSTKTATERFLSSTLDTIVDAAANGDKVTLINFGTFETRHRKGREGRNPQTGEPVSIPAATLPTFCAGKGFKEKVNG